ncbi:hypothetical protein M5K25_004643 [Dendrobium thyrsiflorum]|uniref:Uncharacterized protein n=1 Tax=Dendrobium thyrsiflorum TaxID=117978 RepID=A0ABD0VMS4_DENTH
MHFQYDSFLDEHLYHTCNLNQKSRETVISIFPDQKKKALLLSSSMVLGIMGKASPSSCKHCLLAPNIKWICPIAPSTIYDPSP